MTSKVSRGSTPLFKPMPPPGEVHYLDVPTFQVALDTALKNNAVVGYVAQLRQHGQILFTNTWQYARRPQEKQNGSELWTPDVQMHVASVSKLMTAMAMMVLFRDHNISDPPWDAQIINYLPENWPKGPGIQFITFLNLFQHTSGLSTNDPVDFGCMQSVIAAGIDLGKLGDYNYQNVNYGLFRILLPIINGDLHDVSDDGTIGAYETYLQAKVFQPSGVVGATLDQQPECALAYVSEGDTTPGWNPGNMEESCGCDGWHLSVNQLLDVMGEFRRGGGILTPAAAQAMLDIGFGVDPLNPYATAPLPTALPTAAGPVYCKPGDWHDAPVPPQRDEQTLAYFLPEDMELAVFVNSTVNGLTGISSPPNYFRSLVTQTYQENLTQQPPFHL